MASNQPLRIVDYGPYLNGQQPNTPVSEAQMDQDMAQIATIGNTIRLYTIEDDQSYVVYNAANYGLQVIPAVYLDALSPAVTDDPASFDTILADNPAVKQELDDLIAVLKDPRTDLSNIPFVVIGNEEISQVGGWDDYALLDAIAYVKSQTPDGITFTTAESAGGQYYLSYNENAPDDHHTRLGAGVGVIYANILPYWESLPINQAVNQVVTEYDELTATYPGKEIVISETGWPSGGSTYGAAVPSLANEQAFWNAFIPVANQDGIQFGIFEAYDEPWKSTQIPGNTVDDSWGVFNDDGSAKVDLALPAVVSASASPSHADATTGMQVTLTLTMNNTVTVAGGSPSLTLNDGGTAAYNAAQSGGASLVFDYTIQAGQVSTALAITGVNLNGATVRDSLLDNAGFAAAPTVFTGLGVNVAGSTLVSDTADLNGDGTSDIVLQDSATGGIGQFQMHNGQSTWSYIGATGSGWTIAGTGDFNGDGSADILLRDTSTGDIGEFQMNNGQATWSYIGWADPSWTIAGVGDINGDGTSDIVFRNANTGDVGAWQMQNGQATWTYLGWADPAWDVAGVGDLNGDGLADILFRDRSTGALGAFLMQDGHAAWSAEGWAATNWQVAGIGDFNGDGTSDVLFRDDSTGALGAFLMQNAQPSWDFIGSASTDWQVAGIGDYNGDGTSDILFRDSGTGAIGQFQMHNGQATWSFIGWTGSGWNVAA
jgi:exo-beta-1,3-glucanase (GH17 family)